MSLKIRIFHRDQKIHPLLLFLSFIIPGILNAQGRHQEVTIIAPFQPSLSEVIKPDLNPEMPDTVVRVPEMTYSVQSFRYPTGFEMSPLKPVYLQIDPVQKLNRNYLKVGFGNYSTPYISFFSNTLRSSKYSAGFAFRHHSSSGQIKNHPKSAFSNNRISLYGTRSWAKRVIGAEINYSREVVHYYGVIPQVDSSLFSIPQKELRQRFSLIDSKVTLTGTGKSNPDFNAALSFYHLNDFYRSKETGLSLDGHYHQRKKFLNVANEEELVVNILTNLYLTRDTLYSFNSFLLHLNPLYNLRYQYLDLQIGLKPAISIDSTVKLRIYPDLAVAFKVVPDHLRLYFSATGELKRNTLHSVSRENPWINPIFPYDYTDVRYELKGGLTGKMNSYINFHFGMSYADVRNLLLFINDFQTPFNQTLKTNFGNKFSAVYDDARITTFLAEAGVELSDKLRAGASIKFYDYQLEREEHPWHKPNMEILLRGSYLITPELSLSGEIFYVGTSWARNELLMGSYSVEKLKPYLDLNLEGEYSVNEWLSAFLNLNNLIATRYYRWYAYPSQRLNALVGVKIAL